MNEKNRIELAAGIVAAYVENNRLPADELPALIQSVHAALGQSSEPAPADPAKRLTPAEIRRSIKPDGLVSFEDGRTYKTLKRHLTKQGLTPAQYREKWGLPNDYPLVAASYAEQRSKLAKQMGLGQGVRRGGKGGGA